MVILPESSQEIVYVEVLTVYRNRAFRHFLAVLVAHELVERVEAWNDVAVILHPVDEH